jgi:hypothetical protein
VDRGGGFCGGAAYRAAKVPVCAEDAARRGEVHSLAVLNGMLLVVVVVVLDLVDLVIVVEVSEKAACSWERHSGGRKNRSG